MLTHQANSVGKNLYSTVQRVRQPTDGYLLRTACVSTSDNSVPGSVRRRRRKLRQQQLRVPIWTVIIISVPLSYIFPQPVPGPQGARGRCYLSATCLPQIWRKKGRNTLRRAGLNGFCGALEKMQAMRMSWKLCGFFFLLCIDHLFTRLWVLDGICIRQSIGRYHTSAYYLPTDNSYSKHCPALWLNIIADSWPQPNPTFDLHE